MKNAYRRREFLETALKLGAGAMISSCPHIACERNEFHRKDIARFFPRGGRPLFVVLRGPHPEKLLSRGLGAVLETAGPGPTRKKMLIKPNATANEPYPVTTDPSILSAMIDFFKKTGFDRFTIADNPSYRGMMVRKLFRDRGYFRLGRTAGVRVLPRDPARTMSYVKMELPDSAANRIILVNRDLLSADLTVNTAIPKRHHEADFTCALKNNFGAVYDSTRTRAHLIKAGNPNSGTEFFDRTIAECAAAASPGLTVVDARALLVKSGPSLRAGGVVKEGVGEIIISTDMVAVDVYCSELMSRHDPTYVPGERISRQLAFAEALGLGTSDLSALDLVEIHS
ncbi:MAG: hypothetical protein A2028_03995 [Candidatus Aminicenantes bacterium RBG_19FT_COMBO_59_29]|nr:MAG: hypothetical protein A2028_03995 [Candidatus Aminicenantes bacterium RBG_19FT_COMBO_59_29]